MARPVKSGIEYFSHDTDASSDDKIEALRALHGNDGYAFYFIILERIFRTGNPEYSVENDAVFAALLKKIGVSKSKFQNILKSAFDLFLLDRESYETRKVLTSNGIKRRIEGINSKRKRDRDRKSGAENPEENEENSESFPQDNPPENDANIPIRKEKESKAKETKGKEKDNKKEKTSFAEFVSLSQEEFEKLVSEYQEHGAMRMIQILNNYKGASGKKYKSDYLAILNWVVNRYKEEQAKAGKGLNQESPLQRLALGGGKGNDFAGSGPIIDISEKDSSGYRGF